MSDSPFDETLTLDMSGRIGEGSVIEGRYVVLAPIGRGGFATVFRGHQAHIDRAVAIKVLNIALSVGEDRSFEQRFVREARLAAQLAHANVVTVYDFGFTGELRQPYMVMELLEGETLEDRLRRGPLEPAHALALLDGALDALALGHGAGVVHKDLKPANLFLTRTRDGRELLKVLDFGIARQTGAGGTRFTASGQFLGTPQYAAPEYVQSQEVAPSVDVYQMGLILGEMLCGRPLVDSPNPMQCLRIHAEGRLEVPGPLLDTALLPVLRTALATAPAARFRDAAGLRDALRRLDVPALARRLSSMDLARAPRRPLFDDSGLATDTTLAMPQPPEHSGPFGVPAPSGARPRAHSMPLAAPHTTPPEPSPRRERLLVVALAAGSLLVLAAIVAVLLLR